MQRALAVVQAEAGVSLDTRGRHGTYLVDLDRVRLWQLAGHDQLLGLMPLPYSRRYEGLATGLLHMMQTIGIPSSLGFLPGARRRLDAIERGESFAVISGLAFEQSRREGRTIIAAVEMGRGSYVTSHGVIRRREPARGRLRVGIDPDSIDQTMLSRAEFGDRATYRPMGYMHIVEAVRRNLLDAAVWVLDTGAADDVVETTPLTAPAAVALDNVATQAVLAVREGDRVRQIPLRSHRCPRRRAPSPAGPQRDPDPLLLMPELNLAERLALLEVSGQGSADVIAFVHSEMGRLEGELGIPFADGGGELLVTHLVVALDRLQRGEPFVASNGHSEVVAAELSTRPEMVVQAHEVASRARSALGAELPDSEIGLIALHLAALSGPDIVSE